MRISLATVFFILSPIIFAQEIYFCYDGWSVAYQITYSEKMVTVNDPWRWINSPVVCNITLTNIPARSWVGVFKDTFSLFNVINRDAFCWQTSNHLRIYHPARGEEYFCGSEVSSVMYTAYSEEEAYLHLMLHGERGYNPSFNDLKLSVKVASVVYSRENTIREEEAKYSGNVVSHSLYPKERYNFNITSTLILSGLNFSTRIRVQFHKLSFDEDCADYLDIHGIRRNTESTSQLKICSTEATSSRYDGLYTTTDFDLTIRFVSRSKQRGYGFRLSYEVQSPGCDKLEIPHSSITFDPVDSRTKTFFLRCDEGYSFNGTDQSTERVICDNKEWFRLFNCTVDCSWQGKACYQGCNKDNGIESLQCIPIDKIIPEITHGIDVSSTTHNGEETSMSTSMITYIGIGVGTFLLMIVVVVIVSVLLYRRRKRLLNENKTSIHFSKSREVDTSPIDTHIYDSPSEGGHDASYGVYTLADDMPEPLHQNGKFISPTPNEYESVADSDFKEDAEYANVPVIASQRSDSYVQMIENDLYVGGT